MTKKPTEKARKAAVEKWSNTPAENPRYEDMTPGQMGHALLGKPVCHTVEKVSDPDPAVKSGV